MVRLLAFTKFCSFLYTNRSSPIRCASLFLKSLHVDLSGNHIHHRLTTNQPPCHIASSFTRGSISFLAEPPNSTGPSPQDLPLRWQTKPPRQETECSPARENETILQNGEERGSDKCYKVCNTRHLS